MLSDEQVAKFRRDGFVLGSQVLGDDEIEELRGEMQRVIDDQGAADKPQPVQLMNMGRADAPVWQIVNIWMASAAFRRLVDNDTIVAELTQLSESPQIRIWHDQIQYKPAATGGVNMWHQDSPYWPILTPNDRQLTAWVALDDVDLENGCMSMVPGSHLWGDQIDFLHTLTSFDEMPTRFDGNEVHVAACPVRKGQVHYHHALTWHGSSANHSGRPRRAVALHYMTGETRYVASGGHPMKPYVEVADGEVLQGRHFPAVRGA